MRTALSSYMPYPWENDPYDIAYDWLMEIEAGSDIVEDEAQV